MTTCILFGDIHNHNAFGYGKGSLERTIEIAGSHLDFFAFTGHSRWHDLEPMEGGRERHWLEGFERLRSGWPKVQRLIADANRDGEFAAFLGFEWHSSTFGDQCVVFPDDHRPLADVDDVWALRRFCEVQDALMIPHHLAYPQGHRGVNWKVFEESCTPVVEIFSEHGNSEHDRGPYTFFNHSMGGRDTTNTVRHALAQGLRFGFVASSDSHSGFPGAYDEGLLGVHAADLSRRAIMEAIRARRTYALTGDQIEVWFFLNGASMGSSLACGVEADVAYEVHGRDELACVELVQDGRTVHRVYADQLAPDLPDAPFQVRLEWGWGPWGDLALERICEWELDVRVTGGRVLRAFPCLRSGPFDEDRRHVVRQVGEDLVTVRSFTSRRGAYRENPNHSVVLEVAGEPGLAFEVAMRQPVADTSRVTRAELAERSVSRFTGPFPKESWQWHRLVPRGASRIAGTCRLPVPRDRSSYVYLRAVQANGQMAWASPVFLNYDERRQRHRESNGEAR